jgi:hypothetical protein
MVSAAISEVYQWQTEPTDGPQLCEVPNTYGNTATKAVITLLRIISIMMLLS